MAGPLDQAAKAWSGFLDDERPALRAAKWALALVAFVLVVQTTLSPYPENYVFGGSIGALYGITGVAIILVYRTNRIINFAAAGLGAVTGLTGVLFVVIKHAPFWPCFLGALVAAVGLGAAVEYLVIRRFSQAPRLILTVATIGVAQGLAYLGLKIRSGLGKTTELSPTVPTPYKDLVTLRYGEKRIVFLDGNEVVTILLVLLAAAALAAFFRYTRMGIAVRASAENADRASLLGIPVKLVGTVAWSLAGVLAALTVFQRSVLAGVPVDGSLGYSVLVYALAAAVVAKMDRIPVAIAAGVGVGIIEQAAVNRTGKSSLATALMLVVILGALLSQRKNKSRALDVGSLTFQTVKEFRPIPTELRGLPEVAGARAVLGGLVAALALGAPYLVTEGQLGKLTLIPIECVIVVSLVVLTGWAGQISLGHYGIVGIAGAAAGGLAANHDIDFFAALILGALVGMVVSVLIGVPALRVQGLYLAVTTLAFAAAAEGWALRAEYPLGELLLPKGNGRIPRPLLWGRIDTESERTYYYLCVAVLALVVLAARSFRKNRSGRVLMAVRDNNRAAPAYGINLARTKLAAFAVSGSIAAVAGVLFAYQQRSIEYQSYGVDPSVFVFIAAVVGGLTSLPGAIAGAVLLKSLNLFGGDLSVLASSVGLLAILVFLPGGLAQVGFGARDRYLRWVAARRGLLVPSLLADRRVETAAAELDEDEVISHAEHAAEEAAHAHPPMVRCPVCEARLRPEDAVFHEHLRVPDPAPAAERTDLTPVAGG